MPWRSGNAIPIGTGWTEQATLRWPYATGATRLDVFVSLTDAVAQFLESPNTQGFTDDQSEEVLCRQGFNSIPAETPFYAVRFRVWSATILARSGTIDVRMVG